MNDVIDLYLRVREKEGRLYPDDIVKQLPAIPENHPLKKEWVVRTASCRRLTTYLTQFAPRNGVLELGCGNGWLAHQIALSTRSPVVGMDHQLPELAQALRLFDGCRNLNWILADIFSAPFAQRSFDVIVLASVIQYFSVLTDLLDALRPLLSATGEIHILDSPLYPDESVEAARERSRRYYDELGFSEMTAHYHHHSAAVLNRYNPVWLYLPESRRDRSSNNSPFPWVCLRQ